jgi:methionyl-tRNA formyltransferase
MSGAPKRHGRLLLLGKPDDARLEKAAQWLREHWAGEVSVRQLRQPAWPADLSDWSGDYLISYRCPAIVSASVLSRVACAALNFHPAPPEYRGIGTVNFALFENTQEYGVTCHHMTPHVDSGPIVAVRRFPIGPDDSVSSVLTQTYDVMLELFYDVLGRVVGGRELSDTGAQWSGPVRTRADLNALCVVTSEMSGEEVRRRVRAVDYPGFPGAYVTLGGVVFRADAGGRLPRS